MRALILAAAVPLFGASAFERLGLITRPAPVPVLAPAPHAAARGEGIVSGYADFNCPRKGRSALAGKVALSGPVRVEAGGLSGLVLVSALEPLSGLCSSGQGTLMQTVTLRGTGTLQDAAGLRRRVTVSGRVPLSASGPGPRLWLRAYLYVK